MTSVIVGNPTSTAPSPTDTPGVSARPGRAPLELRRVLHTISTIRYAGTYRFENREVLHRALAAARDRIDDEDDLAALEGGWLRCFVMHGTTLTVNVALPASPEHRFAAAEIFAVLSRDAIGGSVRATIDGNHVDEFIPGDED